MSVGVQWVAAVSVAMTLVASMGGCLSDRRSSSTADDIEFDDVEAVGETPDADRRSPPREDASDVLDTESGRREQGWPVCDIQYWCCDEGLLLSSSDAGCPETQPVEGSACGGGLRCYYCQGETILHPGGERSFAGLACVSGLWRDGYVPGCGCP